jgi:hypothetical protein
VVCVRAGGCIQFVLWAGHDGLSGDIEAASQPHSDHRAQLLHPARRGVLLVAVLLYLAASGVSDDTRHVPYRIARWVGWVTMAWVG